jgi:uncharacterized protein YabE (DUF348 family)
MIVLVAQLAVLAAVVGVALAFVSAQKSVTVLVDGSPTTVRTFDGSVRAVLEKAHVELGEHDTVSPNLNSHVGDHATINVGRGRRLSLNVDGEPGERWVTAASVGDALDELGLTVDGEYVSLARSERIPLSGAVLVVRRPQTVRLLVDGTDRAVVTTAPTVAEFLRTSAVSLSDLDRLSVDDATYPSGGLTVSVTRVSAKQEVTSQVIAHAVQRVADDTLYVGKSRTVQTGQDGVMTYVYATTYQNGQLTDRVLTAQQLTTAPQPTVVAYGTKPVPVVTAPALSIDGLNWAALARCESNNNPRSVSAGGTYRGLYQFSLSAWRGVGGSGDPIDASPAEQTHRAQLLYRSSGRGVWPTCGRLL